jgi:hypothetical protein
MQYSSLYEQTGDSDSCIEEGGTVLFRLGFGKGADAVLPRFHAP